MTIIELSAHLNLIIIITAEMQNKTAETYVKLLNKVVRIYYYHAHCLLCFVFCEFL